MQEIIFIRSWPFDMVKNNLIAELPYIGKEYIISFQLLITEFPVDPNGHGYFSVIQVGLGGDNGPYGDRAPCVWLNMAKFLHIMSSISGNKNYVYNTQVDLAENKWIKIELEQTLTDGKAGTQD